MRLCRRRHRRIFLGVEMHVDRVGMLSMDGRLASASTAAGLYALLALSGDACGTGDWSVHGARGWRERRAIPLFSR